ncbi:MAG: hypothetical protein M1840_007028 [Geoglossum simile]|nr:MAG: hypothetical protein M1840_007028 [Geoglossum simile]
MVAIGSLLWHLFPGDFVKAQQAFITKLYSGKDYQDVSAIKLTLILRRPIIIKPGQYLYLRILGDLQFRDWFQAHPFMIAWWDEPASVEASEEGASVSSSDKDRSRGDTTVTPPGHTKAKALTFLIQPYGGLSARLGMRPSIKNVVLDGPYGQDLHLEHYETVLIVAQGIGITGVLPYAHHLANWKLHQNMSYKRAVMTRKLDLYWLLEENCQERWVGDYLKELQEKDIKQDLLQIWCYYPSKKNSEPLMKPKKGVPAYQCFYPGSPYKAIPNAIKEVAGKSPGRNIVVAVDR